MYDYVLVCRCMDPGIITKMSPLKNKTVLYGSLFALSVVIFYGVDPGIRYYFTRLIIYAVYSRQHRLVHWDRYFDEQKLPNHISKPEKYVQ